MKPVLPFPPYEIAVTRRLPLLDVEAREQVLRDAGYNSYAIPQDKILMDLKTDGGTGALSSTQVSSLLELATLEASTFDLSPQSSPKMPRFVEQAGELFGFPYVVACNMGRAAERLYYSRYSERLKDGVVPGNVLFTSTKFQVESRGGRIEDLTCVEADDLSSSHPFKGNIDVDRLTATIKEVGASRIPFVGIELCVNGFAGHPIALGNIEQVKKVLEPHGIPLVIDACRLLANSRLIQMFEDVCKGMSIREIVKKTLSFADGCTWSASKEFGVRALGAVFLRDKKQFDDITFQSMIEGVQAQTSSIHALTFTIDEAFDADEYAGSRVAETQRFWELLRARGVPVVHPAGGYAVYLDLHAYCSALGPDDNAPYALAAHVYRESGIRIGRGYFPSPRQIAKRIDLMRLCVPPRRYTTEHYSYAAAALAEAYAKRASIRPLRVVPSDPTQSRFDTRYAPA